MAKILLVEDDLDLLDALRSLLELHWHEVQAVCNGRAALEELGEQRYDLIVLDWILPGLLGEQVCAKFRSSGGQTPILMLTGTTMGDPIDGVLPQGINKCLRKPFNAAGLFAAVNDLLIA